MSIKGDKKFRYWGQFFRVGSGNENPYVKNYPDKVKDIENHDKGQTLRQQFFLRIFTTRLTSKHTGLFNLNVYKVFLFFPLFTITYRFHGRGKRERASIA